MINNEERQMLVLICSPYGRQSEIKKLFIMGRRLFIAKRHTASISRMADRMIRPDQISAQLETVRAMKKDFALQQQFQAVTEFTI